jgi:hypothetical protein
LCCGVVLDMWLLLALLAVGTAANIDCKFSLFTFIVIIIIIIIIMSQPSKQKQAHGRIIMRFSSTVIYTYIHTYFYEIL